MLLSFSVKKFICDLIVQKILVFVKKFTKYIIKMLLLRTP